uniref:RING-type domain-containing protein n=1 Tax=Caenorhabditis tropicalis TaxID=1561998 RepID=A0A1I7V3R0_9PELO
MGDQQPTATDITDLDRRSPVDHEHGDSPYNDSDEHEEDFDGDDSKLLPCPFEKEDHPIWDSCQHCLEQISEEADEETDEEERAEGSSEGASRARRITCPICSHSVVRKEGLKTDTCFQTVDPAFADIFKAFDACAKDPTLPLPTIPGTMDKNGIVTLNSEAVAKLTVKGYPFSNKK